MAWKVKQFLSSQAILHSLGLAPAANAYLHSQWNPPDMEWIKLISDGTCCHGGKDTTCGGVLKDWVFQWIQGFYAYIRKGVVTSVELWGALNGLNMT